MATGRDRVRLIWLCDNTQRLCAARYIHVQHYLWVQGRASLLFYTANGSSPAERMRILSNGNVGIGTTSPNGILHVNDPANSGGVLLRLGAGVNAFDFARNNGTGLLTLQGTQ